MDAVDKKAVGAYTVEVHYDDDSAATDPRDWDHGTMMVLSHRRYDLPNDAGIDFDAFDSWAEVESQLRDEYNVAALLPVRGYDHGSLHLATTDRGSFSDPWDSGMAGFVFVTKESQATMGTPDDLLADLLTATVTEYDDWTNGQVYGYTVKDAAGEVVDSCWGYIGESDYAMSEGVAMAEWCTFRDACDWASVPEWMQMHVLIREEAS